MVSLVKPVVVGTRRHRGTFVSVKYVSYLTCGGGVTGHISPNWSVVHFKYVAFVEY